MLLARTLCACRAIGPARRVHCALYTPRVADDLNANSLLLLTAMVLRALTSCCRTQGATFARADCAGADFRKAPMQVHASP